VGVEYRHYLIPRPNTFRPTVDAALALVAALRRDNLILAPDSPALKKLPFRGSSLYGPAKGWGYYAQAPGRDRSFSSPLERLLSEFADQDLQVVWPVESLGDSGLRFPLDPVPFDDPRDAAECYYKVLLHFGRDLIYHTSEVIDPFDPEPVCACGRNLMYYPEGHDDPFYSARLAATCPECGSPFDPTGLLVSGRDGWTGRSTRLPGGAAYRFAVVIDCGKFFGGKPLRFDHRLSRLIENTLGVETYEVPDFY
jgi:hypothetical protein